MLTLNSEGGKMAEFLTTTGISYNLEKLIKSSEEKLFLVSPYLQIADRTSHQRERFTKDRY